MTGVRDEVPRTTGGLPGAGLRGGLLALAVAVVLYLADLGPKSLLGVAAFGLQVLLSLAWLALLDAPAGVGAFIITTSAAAIADLLVGRHSGPTLSPIAGVIGLSLVAAALYQLSLRSARARVTDALAATLSTVLLCVSVTCLIALRAGPSGREVVGCGAIAAGVALFAERLADKYVGIAAIPAAVGRTLGGTVAALAVGAGLGIAFGAATARIGQRDGAVIGLAAAAIATLADITMARLVPEIDPSDTRRSGALAPLAPLLPLALACPAAYVAGRLLLG